ncbi:hypothetical protein C6V80_00695 [Caminibacter pacificus]|uniref:Uncharacterized protein n=1 Tax=Caminibacter pacificus TaxID=1424653 RepID=A0AAJ4UXE3_9BACT|nr:hypothetical protein C6V80_00695 [Caminibacter pacificus]ROR38973.1 hypothetical protein EDC58_1892 [Caminibacter pacificus]
MNLKIIHKLLLGVFVLFLLFSAIVILVGDYLNDPLLSIVIFIVILYVVYYLGIKFFMNE